MATPTAARGPSAIMERSVERYCQITATRPLGVCLLVLLWVLVICVLPLVFFRGDDLIDLDFTLSSMLVRGNDITDRLLSLWAAEEATECSHGYCDYGDMRLAEPHDAAVGNQSMGPRRLSHRNGEVTVVFGSKDGENILTESRLLQAMSLERKVAEMVGEPKATPFGIIFNSYPHGTGMNGTLEQVLVATAEYVHDSRHVQGAWPFFSKNFSACSSSSQIISVLFHSPSDYDTYNDITVLETDELYTTFFWGVNSWGKDDTFYGKQRTSQIGKDQFLIIGTFVFCIILIGAQTRSLFISIVSWFAILLATGVAFSLYRIIVTKWFGILNAMSVFLLLGIACDDIFVVADSWRQAVEVRGIAPDDYAGRLRFMMPRAFGAITTTSLTTAGAFFGNAISVIPPLRLFGVFAGFMVLADWILTISLLPAVFVLQHKWFGKFNCGPWRAEPASGSPRLLEKLVTQRFAPCVFKIAPFLVVFFAVVASISLNLALEIKPGAEFHESDLFPHDHVQARGYRAMQLMANLKPRYISASIVYGVVPVDTGDLNNPSSTSDITWDTSFDVYSLGVQEFTLDLCNDLLAQRGMVRRVQDCWAQHLRARVVSTGKPFPADRNNFDQAMSHHLPGLHLSPSGEKWVTINFETTVKYRTEVSELRNMYDKFEEFMQKWNQEAERRGLSGVARGFQASEKWRFMSTIENMAVTCISACCISTLVVLVMLFILMGNFIMVAMILLHVIIICLTLVASFVLEGRSLGVLESIATALLVGLSVDYLVHVGSAYLDEAEDVPRERRTLSALAHMGGSVLAGSATSVISAIFLCFGTITFFGKFGLFMIGILSLSLIFTLLSFVSLLYLFGPEKRFGSMRCSWCSRHVFDETDGNAQPNEDGDANNFLTENVETKKAPRHVMILTAIAAIVILITGGCIRLVLSLKTGDEAELSACPAQTELTFTFNEYAIPQNRDSYRCRDYDEIPSGCTYYMTGWEPIISHGFSGVVHHMLLFSIEGLKSTCPYTCFDMPNAVGMDAAWAVGSGPVTFPDGLSYPVGGYKHALQIHYYNPNQKSSLVDKQSGMRLKLTSTRPSMATLTSVTVGLHPLGNMWIEPQKPNKTVFVECKPELAGPVTVIAYATHAHKLGFSILTEVRRQDASGHTIVVGDVGSDPIYDFDYQRVKLFAAGHERHVKPGDAVRVICSFDSSSRMDVTKAGWGSEDEMCMTFLWAYPSQNVANRNCLSDSSFEEGPSGR